MAHAGGALAPGQKFSANRRRTAIAKTVAPLYKEYLGLKLGQLVLRDRCDEGMNSIFYELHIGGKCPANPILL